LAMAFDPNVAYSAAGIGLLQYNPLLTVRWTGFESPVTEDIGFSPTLVTNLEARNILVDINSSNIVPANRPPGLFTPNELGNLGDGALEEIYQARGFTTKTQVNTLGGIFGQGRRVDVVATKPGLLGGEMVYGEAKVGYKTMNWTTARETGRPIYQMVQDANSLFYNRAARFVGKGLGIAGVGLDAVMTGADIYGKLSQGDTAGAAISGAEFGGRWAGAAAFATAGAQAGFALGSFFPGFGNVIGAGVGGFVGGIVGGYLGEEGVNRILGYSSSQSSSIFGAPPPPVQAGAANPIQTDSGTADNGFGVGTADQNQSTELDTSPSPVLLGPSSVIGGGDIPTKIYIYKIPDGYYEYDTNGNAYAVPNSYTGPVGADQTEPAFTQPMAPSPTGNGSIPAPSSVAPEDLTSPSDVAPPVNALSSASGPPTVAGTFTSGSDYPIILDLTGNGINIKQLTSSNEFFDMAGDGQQSLTAWAGAGNGVLFYDPTGSGQLTQANQIIFTDWDPTAASDMQALRDVFDTNHDGSLDAGDTNFINFFVMETNADGTQTAHSLGSLGITSIGLNADATNIALPDGSMIDGETTYTTSSGSGTAATVTLASDPVDDDEW
jgi:hypothetical protein